VLLTSRVLLLTLSLAFANTASGGVIYSNLGSDPTRLFNDAFLDYASDARPANEKLAMSFVAAGNQDWMVTQIDLALREDLGGSFAARLSIYTDSAGLPGVPLGTWTLSNLAVNSHLVGVNCCAMTSLSLASSSVILTGGSSYFLVAQPIGVTVTDVWYWNTTGATGANLKADATGRWRPNRSTTLGAFDVLGVEISSETPEPSTLLLFVAGIAGCALCDRRRRA
jgi:hypothetical protein